MLEQCPIRIGVLCAENFSRDYLFSNQCLNFECSRNGHGLSFVRSFTIYLHWFCHCSAAAQWTCNAKWVIISKLNIFLFKSNSFVSNLIFISAHNFSHFHIMVYCTILKLGIMICMLLKYWTYKITAKYTFHHLPSNGNRECKERRDNGALFLENKEAES